MGEQWPERRQVEPQTTKRPSPEGTRRDAKAPLRSELRALDFAGGAARLRPPATAAPGPRRAVEPTPMAPRPPLGDGGMTTADGAREAGVAAAQCEAPPPIQPTDRTPHEWRMALLGARAHLVGQVRDVVQERYNRDDAALSNFANTMAFAQAESVVGLVIGGAFGALSLTVPGALAAVASTLALASDIYAKANASCQGVALSVWIEQHRGDLQHFRELQFDPDTNPALLPFNQSIEALVADESYEGERKKQELEQALTSAKLTVDVTTADLELHLYSAWCETQGARFVAHVYESNRDYPGQEEVGTTDQNHPAFKGRQVFPVNIPTQILDRLQRPGLDARDPKKPVDPLRLNLPVDTMHHQRQPGGVGGPTWQDAGVTHLERGGKP